MPGHQQHHFFIPTEYRTGKTNLSHHGNDQHQHCKTRIPLADKTISCKCFTTRLFTFNLTLHHQSDRILHQPVRSCAYRKAFQFIFLLPFFRIEEQIMHIYCSSSSISFTCPWVSLTVVIYHAAIKIKCRKAVCSSASSIAVKLYSSFIRTLPEYTFSETDTFSDIFCFS